MPPIPFSFIGPEGNTISGKISDCRECICYDPDTREHMPSRYASGKFLICIGEPDYEPKNPECAFCVELETNFQILKGRNRNGS